MVALNAHSAALRARGQLRGKALRSQARSTAAQASTRPVAAAEGEVRQTAMQRLGTGAASLGLAASLLMGPVTMPATAGELDVLGSPVPSSNYIVDDGSVLSRSATGALQKELAALEKDTGYRVEVVTLRKLVFQSDVFAFADKLIETWYPTAELGDKKAVFVLVKGSKEAGLVGGPSFNKFIDFDLVDSIVNDNVAILANEEKFNEAVSSSVKRIEAKLKGETDPGPPVRFEAKKGSNFKTKEETSNKRDVFANVVIGLLVISFIVPMIQYFGYVSGGGDE
mmetsp:Transcript_8073/g.26832  ORF Transcript_8073/g.26832 Transcript_8073/m.26832 type:complete len:282 (-) Transcript_8073:910-1755(-)